MRSLCILLLTKISASEIFRFFSASIEYYKIFARNTFLCYNTCMPKTTIKVVRVREAGVTATFYAGLFAMWLFGMSLGILYNSARLPFTTEHSGMLATPIGSESALQIDSPMIPKLPSPAVLNIGEVAGESSNYDEDVVPESNTEELFPEVLGVTTDMMRTDLESEVRSLASEVTSLTEQVERIKNQSVYLVTEFETNCGAWANECATPYASQLEKKNTEYAELAKRLLSAKSLLAERESDLALLLQE